MRLSLGNDGLKLIANGRTFTKKWSLSKLANIFFSGVQSSSAMGNRFLSNYWASDSRLTEQGKIQGIG